jgi:hypothetical protein
VNARAPGLHPLLGLLRAVVDGCAPPDGDALDAGLVRRAIEGGLGPLLRRLTADESPLTASSAWAAVVGAELAARMRCEVQLRALEDLLDLWAGRVPPPTLLKGISLCLTQYAAPHLRPMGDLDLLVDAEWIGEVERLVRELGYRAVGSPERYRRHHHITPLVHPDTDVWIELHHALFPPSTALGADAVFGTPSLRAERRPALFRGRPVHHLSPELQLVYLPAHWAQSPKLLVYARGLLSMLDTMLVLRDRASLRWPAVLGWLDGAAAATQVYLMLAYLDARGLVALRPEILDGLRRRQRSFGPGGLRLAFELLDRYVVDGRPRGRLVDDRVLALAWRALLQPGGVWRKAALVGSTLTGKAARVVSAGKW